MNLENGDKVKVEVNSRAAKHLGSKTFTAKVESSLIDEVVFRPIDQLQDGYDTHTWYSDIGYIHGYHGGLDRYSDIGKVVKVEVIN